MADSEKINSRFFQLLKYAGARRRHFIAVLATLLVFSLAMMLLKGEYSGNLADFFEPQSEAGRTFAVMERAGLTRRMVIEFDFSPNMVDKSVLENACQQLSLVNGVKSVDYRFGTESVAAFLGEGDVIYPYAFSPEQAIPPDRAAVSRNLLIQLMTPGVPAARVQLDPWNLNTRLLGNLGKFYQLSGLQIMPGEEFILHPEGKKALAMLELTVSSADGAAAGKLLSEINETLADYSEEFNYGIFSSLVHTVANEEILKQDVARVGIISALALLILFLLVYRRDWSSLFIVALPFGATLIVTGIMFLFVGKIILFVVGMGGAIVGLAVDYGIHVYAARHENDSLRKIAALALPLLAGCLTTAGVFFLLSAINIAAYRQLGLFAGAALLTSLVLAYLYLPLLVKEKVVPEKFSKPFFAGFIGKIAPIIWVVFVLFAIYFAGNSTLNFGAAEFDGAGQNVKESEERFEAEWRPNGTPAMLTIVRENEELLLQRVEEVTDKLRELAPEIESFAVSDIYSSQAKRQRELEKWQLYLNSGKFDAEEKFWSEAAGNIGLPVNFYTPFFTRLRESVNSYSDTRCAVPPVISQLIKYDGAFASTALFFPDEDQYLSLARQIVGDDPDSAVISRAFEKMIGSDLGNKLKWLIPLALSIIFLVVGTFMGSFRLCVVALLPVVSSWLGIIGLFGGCRIALNLPILISGLLLTGLAIDYGIFGVYAWRNPNAKSVKTAMTMSFLTTFCGVGSLIFSQHPVMFYTGVTLSTGMLIAFLTGFFVVPALAGKQKVGKTAIITVSFLAFLGVSGCYCVPNTVIEAARESAMTTLQAESKVAIKPYTVQGKMIIKSRFGDFSTLFAAQLDERERLVKLIGISPTGNLIYEISGKSGQVGGTAELGEWRFSPALNFGKYERYKENIACELLQAMGNIYFDNSPLEGEGRVGKDNFTLTQNTPDGRRLRYTFGGTPMRLTGKKYYGFWRTYWTLELSKVYYFDTGAKSVERAIYRSRHFTLEFENHAFAKDINNE